MSNEIVRDYTKGNLPKQMLVFSFPFIISNTLQICYSIVDMIVVGNVVGSPGLAAISTASQIVSFMTMFCLGFATGGQVLISQLLGAGRHERLNKTIGTLFSAVFAIGVVMTVAGCIFARPLLQMLQTPEESYEMAVGYLLICSAGMLFTYGYNVVSAVLRGMGNSKQPCIYIVIAAVVNLVLDLLFVIVFDMGVEGAALATVIGQAVSFIWSLFYLVRKKEYFYFDFKPVSFMPKKDELKALVKLGIPFALRSASVNISMMFVTSMVNSVNVAASAVFGVGIKVDDIVNKITLSINYSVSTIVGQNVGAGDYKRTRKTVYWGWAYCSVMYLAFSVVYVLNVELFFGMFTDEQQVLKLAPVFVEAILWSFPAFAIMRGTNGFLQGMGKSVMSLVFAIIDGFILRIGLSYLLGVVLDLGLFGLFLGYGLAAYGTAIPGMIYFISGVWKKKLRKAD